jgi:hypothetical protein
MDIIKRDTILTFGKYKGKKICDLIYHDPGYIIWMSKNAFNVEKDLVNETCKYSDFISSGFEDEPQEWHW